MLNTFNRVALNNELVNLVNKFSEHYHDAWAKRKFENGWQYGQTWSDETKSHPRLKPPHMLSEYERERYREPIRDSLKALLALGWNVEFADYDAANSNRNSMRRSSTDGGTTPYNYNPNPVDMANLTLSREMQNMAERLSENAHDIWARKKKEDMGGMQSVCIQYAKRSDTFKIIRQWPSSADGTLRFVD